MDLAGRAARGAGVTVLAQALRFVIQFGSTIILARLLSPSEVGVVALVTSIVGVSEIIRDFGLSSAAIQAKTLSQGQRSNLFWINTGIGALCTLIAVLCAGLMADFYNQSAVIGIVYALAPTTIVSGMNTQLRADLSRRLRFRSLAVTDVAGQFLAVLVAIVAALLGASYWAIVAQQVTLVVATFVLNAIQCRWMPSWPDRSAPMRGLIRFGFGVLGTHLLGYTTNNADNIGVGRVNGPDALGLYSRAYQLLIVPINQINAPMNRVVLPILSRVQDDQQQVLNYLRYCQLVGIYVLGLAFGLGAGLATPITLIMFGPTWVGVAPIFAALAVGGVFRGLTQVSYWLFLSTGHAGAQFRTYLWTRPLMIALMLGGLPWGPVGVAIGHSVAFAAYWGISYRAAARASGVPTGGLVLNGARSMVFGLVPAGLLAWTVSAHLSGTWLQLVAGGTAGLAWIALALATPLLAPDRRNLVRLLARALPSSHGRHL